MVRLVISDTEGATTVVPLLRDEVTIGRKEGNTIRLTERNISRRHAQLIRVGAVYKLRDLDSYNGVLINGRRIQGESDISIGDQIQLGDYSIVVEEEASKAPEPAPLASRRPAVPARLVMLTQPSPGAEFALPTDRDARLGRSEEVDCPINHRSVSREHAQIKRDADGYIIEDLGSANGVTVNGRTTKEKALRSGDIIELGQVVFRYVGPGEHYFFDPGEATRFRGIGGGGSPNMRLAGALGAVALAALGIVFFSRNQGSEAEGETPEFALTATHKDGAGEPPLASAALVDDGYDKAVQSCRSALSGARYVEAIAHAAMALKVRPEGPEARECRTRADLEYGDEQAYVRGKSALQAGEVETAYQQFSLLNGSSPLRTRPEVATATAEVARARLAAARAALPRNRGEAAQLAESVTQLSGVSSENLSAAQQILTQARADSQVAHVGMNPRPAAPPPARAPIYPPRAAAKPPQPVQRPASPAPVAQPAKPDAPAPAIELASACLARGDNECVIRALEGNASTERELGLLIETYRAIGDAKSAQKNMAVYLKRFPTARRADTYRRMLELQAE